MTYKLQSNTLGCLNLCSILWYSIMHILLWNLTYITRSMTTCRRYHIPMHFYELLSHSPTYRLSKFETLVFYVSQPRWCFHLKNVIYQKLATLLPSSQNTLCLTSSCKAIYSTTSPPVPLIYVSTFIFAQWKTLALTQIFPSQLLSLLLFFSSSSSWSNAFACN